VGNRSPPSAGVGGLVVAGHVRVLLQDVPHAAAQGPGALAVDDTDLQDPLLAAGAEIFRHEVADVGGVEHVQVEFAVDGVFAHG